MHSWFYDRFSLWFGPSAPALPPAASDFSPILNLQSLIAIFDLSNRQSKIFNRQSSMIFLHSEIADWQSLI